MSGAYAIAAEAFEKTLEDLDIDEAAALGDPAALGRRAALLAVAESVWNRHLGPLFNAEQVAALLGVRSRQAVSDLARRGRLLALETASGRKLYPASQFARGGRPYPELASILKIFAGVVETPYTIASWLASPNSMLGDVPPIVWMREGRGSDQLLEVARRNAARLAH